MILVYILSILAYDISVHAIATPCKTRLKNLWDVNVAKSNNWQRPTKKNEWSNCNTESIQDFGTYDFVILGGGTAGAVLASRLSEAKKYSILVLEAGELETEFNKIPAASLYSTLSDANFGYLTSPQKNACFGMNGKKCPFNSAKILGGETSINKMAYIRANKQDFAMWDGLEGAGWSYDDVLPYYKKAEQLKIKGLDCKYHGMDGPLAVSFPDPEPPLSSNILDAAVEIGASIGDYNAETQLHSSRIQVNTLNGVRNSVATAYLNGIPSNLLVVTHALATQIIFDNNNNVVSLTFLSKGASYSVNITAELIVSLGAVNTPQLLMLSGIGPKEELSKFNIPCVADLPVGKKLRDSISLTLNFDTGTCAYDQTSFRQDVLDYCRGLGTLSTPIGQEVVFATIGENLDGRPDIQLTIGVPYTFYATDVYRKLQNYKGEIDNELENINETTIQVTVTLLHTASEGTVKLKSTDPTDHPIINPNYLKEVSDRDDLYEGIKYALKLEDTNDFKNINAKLVDINLRECKKKRGKRFWLCVMKYLAFGEGDGTGTCNMGYDPKTSVVDTDLLVHGVKNLRIVDGSVIPATLSANSAATTVMIAEKIADQIKFIYKKPCPQ